MAGIMHYANQTKLRVSETAAKTRIRIQTRRITNAARILLVARRRITRSHHTGYSDSERDARSIYLKSEIHGLSKNGNTWAIYPHNYYATHSALACPRAAGQQIWSPICLSQITAGGVIGRALLSRLRT